MDWQSVLALACVAVATVWMVRRIVVAVRSQETTGCGSRCDGCDHRASSVTPADAANGFVSLDQVLDTVDRAERR